MKELKMWAVVTEEGNYPFPKVYAVSQKDGTVLQPTCIFSAEHLAQKAVDATDKTMRVIPVTVSYTL